MPLNLARKFADQTPASYNHLSPAETISGASAQERVKDYADENTPRKQQQAKLDQRQPGNVLTEQVAARQQKQQQAADRQQQLGYDGRQPPTAAKSVERK